MTYQLTQGNTILRLSDNAFIPPDPANTDYQTYLAWLEEGNTPDPAPPPAPPEPDWDALRLGLIASTAITNWFESVPALLQNDMAAQIQTQQLDKLLQGLNLTDYSTVKDELNQLLASCNFDLVLT